MLSIFCDTPGTLTAREIEKPLRKAEDVLVRVQRIGVCGTDLHIFSGNQPYLSYPRIMGHELSGTVEEAPIGSSLRAGDVVTIIPYISCENCSACLKGKTNCCKNIAVLGVHCDGGMVE
jgi:threonine dehydrogenase-like Zn-dependent dehydrogenase